MTGPGEHGGAAPVTDTSFRTDLPGAPSSVEALADALARQALPAVDEAVRVAVSARVGIRVGWQGAFAQRSHAVLDELAAHTEEALGELAAIVGRLREYAARLRAAQAGLAELRGEARAAGLLDDGVWVTAPLGRECDLVPYLRRAQALYDMVAAGAADLAAAPATGAGSPSGLGWLMLAPGAAAALAEGRWTDRATALRLRAAATAPTSGEDAAGRLRGRADDLVRRGTQLSRGTSVVMTPMGLVADHAAGESWEQATASQGAGVLAGAAATGATAAALTAWIGPGALVVGSIAFAAGAVAGAGANAAVDARYARAGRRRTASGLAERCGRAGGRGARDREDGVAVRDTRYGLR